MGAQPPMPRQVSTQARRAAPSSPPHRSPMRAAVVALQGRLLAARRPPRTRGRTLRTRPAGRARGFLSRAPPSQCQRARRHCTPGSPAAHACTSAHCRRVQSVRRESSFEPLELADVRSMLAVRPPSQHLGNPQPLVERHARELLTVPRLGLREAACPVPDRFDEPRHPSPSIAVLSPPDQRTRTSKDHRGADLPPRRLRSDFPIGALTRGRA